MDLCTFLSAAVAIIMALIFVLIIIRRYRNTICSFIESTANTLKLYALPDVRLFNQENLNLAEIAKLIHIHDPIVAVWKCKNVLLPMQLEKAVVSLIPWIVQLTKSVFHHAYVVFQTANNFFFSIEKNNEGIIIQRSNYLPDVSCRSEGKNRVEIVGFESRPPLLDKTVGDIIKWLIDQQEVKMPYKMLLNDFNCQGFTDRCLSVLTS
jgi:hypothetical protein